ncbi:hypothetical protein PFJ30894_00712 [Phascolarctobacterium faecium]|jgi:hypothetical protein|nr:hypothetical protein PFJ30894_00712 [Phascolarctobacterium faecium]DAY65004.1 MAG TPA: hypothetical protein [Caudoviricetes sp.]
MKSNTALVIGIAIGVITGIAIGVGSEIGQYIVWTMIMR